jgi:hypothetical protein
MSSQNSGRSRRFTWCVTMLAGLGLAVGASAVAQTSDMSATSSIAKSAENPDLWPAPGRNNELTRSAR